MSFKLPKISVKLALTIMSACLVAFGVVLFAGSSADRSSQTLAALAEIPLADSAEEEAPPVDKAIDVVVDEVDVPQVVAAEASVELPDQEPVSKVDPTLEEKVIVSQEPLELPKEPLDLPENRNISLDGQGAKAPRVVDMSDVHKIEDFQGTAILPHLNKACLEKRSDSLELPMKSPQGVRPFDAYKSDFFTDDSKVYVTVVISELGANPALFDQAKAMFPKEVTFAFLASRTLSQGLNIEARELGYETLLMIPMEPMDYPKSDPGAGVLLTNLKPEDLKQRFEGHLSQFTGYMGVMPYMGSRFSRVKSTFVPILEDVKTRGLAYFEPRLVRSKAAEWKPSDLLFTRGALDIMRGSSTAKIKEILDRAKISLSLKRSVVITLQADAMTFKELEKWLPTVLNDDVALAPLSAVTQ